jgi:hypothetical protein
MPCYVAGWNSWTNLRASSTTVNARWGAEDLTDPYRRGMLLTARVISTAERTWLREILDSDPPGRATGTRAASMT